MPKLQVSILKLGILISVSRESNRSFVLRSGADKSLAFPIFYFPICSTSKSIFLGWVKEVRTTKSQVCGAQGEYVE
jgi:hypothetical protein